MYNGLNEYLICIAWRGRTFSNNNEYNPSPSSLIHPYCLPSVKWTSSHVFCCTIEKATEQTVELSVFWGAIELMWRRWNDSNITNHSLTSNFNSVGKSLGSSPCPCSVHTLNDSMIAIEAMARRKLVLVELQVDLGWIQNVVLLPWWVCHMRSR